MANEPRTLEGVQIDERAPLARCKACGQLIWWGLTRAGKRNPFDVEVETQRRTAVTHWSTCPRREQFIESRQHA